MKHILFLCIAALIFSCQGDEGEPGPKGDQGEQGLPGSAGADGQDGEGLEKEGFFEGTVSGNRKNGTAFNETFKYEYSFEKEGFSYDDDLGKYVFEIVRQEIYDENFLNMSFEVLNKGTASEALVLLSDGTYYDSEPLYFSLQKEISANTLLRVEASAKVTSTDFTHIVNPTANVTYKFALGENGYYAIDNNADGQLVLRTTDGKRVYFESEYENYDNTLDYYYGNFIKVLNADGSVAANAPYNQLRSSSIDNTFIFRNLAGTDLSSTVTVPGDVIQISNYTKNATTGIMTFDFTITIGTLARTNSSGHPLTITGKFNSGTKVYSDIVSRKRG